MKSFALISLAAAVAALPQTTPAGCQSTVSGTFQITTVLRDGATKRSLAPRQLDGPVTITLVDGILKDQAGRQGSIVANYQFQFDNPLQNNALVVSGFALCGPNYLAVLGDTDFFQCLSGDFYNLYSDQIRPDCIPINIEAVNFSAGPAPAAPAAPAASTRVVTQIPDGQPQATTAASRVVTQIPDGQPQASRPVSRVVTQIPDGQPQASRPVSRVITQISDGQPQASRPVVTQIPDGQPQASRPVSRVITQISDGQPQASRPVITQISDGQPQASRPASVSRVITQISDGQPQASRPVVTQISDGQPQASRPALASFTGAAAPVAGNVGAFAAGVFGVLALL